MRHIVLFVLLTGCWESHGRGGVIELDAGPGTPDSGCVTIIPDSGTPATPEQVDLLFMVDNSNSMTEEQASLALALPALVEAISTGDANLDGVADFAPVGSLHVGVVTSDMGTGGFTVPTCADSDFGDDGLLRSTRPDPRCAALPAFLEYRPGIDDLTAFASDAACLTTTGTVGCGFEQQLESMLKAVSSASSGTRFFRNTEGHADGQNAGFLRPDSVLAIINVSDENDCSSRDPELYNPSSATYTSDLNLRCFTHAAVALHPVERYVEGLLALRPGQPGRLVMANIVGVPPDLSGQPESTILADGRVDERVDPAMPFRLIPSCDVPGRGVAFPPRRFLETSQALRARGARTTTLSICVEDFSPAVRLVLDEIAAAARPVCR